MRFVLLSVIVAALCGCENPAPPATPDAGPPPDTYVPPFAETLFAPCEIDAQCEILGEGAFCRGAELGPAGGYCTRPCADRTPCEAFGAHHHCLTFEGETESICVPACRNGEDCPRAGYTCFGSIPPTDDGYCMSVCRSDAECGAGTVCNLESGACQTPPLPALAPFNAQCGGDAECTSEFCVEEADEAGTPSGWVFGACLAPCILPAGFNTTNFYSGDTLPTAGCPGGGTCVPANGNAEGDLGTCYATCAGDGDCREGYACLLTIADHTFTSGICVPRDCRSGGCPAGRRCVTVRLTDGSQVGRCAP